MRSRRVSASDQSGRTAPVRPSSEFRTPPPSPETAQQPLAWKLCMGGRRWEGARARCARARECAELYIVVASVAATGKASLDVTERITARLQHGRHDPLAHLRTVHRRVPVQAPELLQLRFHLLG